MSVGNMCNRCYSPGACCREMHLSGSIGDLDQCRPEELDEIMKTNGLPFRFKRFEERLDGSPYNLFSCGELLPSGRCGIYSQRPDVCRNYEPLSDSLCVHYRGAESDERSIVA